MGFGKWIGGIVGFMALVAIAISVLGIYSAITLDTEYRRKEMAIRKVNGAGLKDIALIFARLYIWLLLITAAVAFPIVWMIHSLIKTSQLIHLPFTADKLHTVLILHFDQKTIIFRNTA